MLASLKTYYDAFGALSFTSKVTIAGTALLAAGNILLAATDPATSTEALVTGSFTLAAGVTLGPLGALGALAAELSTVQADTHTGVYSKHTCPSGKKLHLVNYGTQSAIKGSALSTRDLCDECNAPV